MSDSMPASRTLDERKRGALNLLENNTNLWLATGGSRAHLIPVAYVWDGAQITMATFANCRTAKNIRTTETARVAIGHPTDLAMVDGDVAIIEPTDLDTEIADAYAKVSFDPRSLPGLVYLQLNPKRIQAWTGFHEFDGRTVMADGAWLHQRTTEPVGALPAWMAPTG